MRSYIYAIILFGVVLETYSFFAYYQGFPQNTSYYKCIKPTTNGRVIVFLPYFHDQIIPGYLENLKNAVEAELTVEVAIIASRCEPIDKEIGLLKGWLSGINIDRFWVIIGSISEG